MTLLPETEGRAILVTDAVGTAVLVVATLAASVSHADGVEYLNAAVAGLLFLGGCIGFAIGFLRAVGRSREEEIALAGLFYLTGSAPPEVRRAFLGLWFIQIGVVVVTIPFTDPPFGLMALVWGIGVITWWAGRYATFPPRVDGPSH
jgi:hypothetical protein